MSDPMIAASSARTNSAKKNVVFSNSASCQRAEASRFPGGVGSRRVTGALSAVVKIVAADAVVDMIYGRPGNPGRRCKASVVSARAQFQTGLPDESLICVFQL